MEADPSTLAERLVSARLESGLGQDAVALRIRMSQQSYSDLETGKSKSTTRIGSLAHLYGVDAYWLETGIGHKRPGVAEQRLEWPAVPPRDQLRTPEERRMLLLFREMTARQRRGLLDAFGPAERQAERPAAADAGRSQDLQPSELTMAFQLANEKIASDGLAPTAEEFGRLVLYIHDLLVGGLTHAELHDLRSGKLPDPSTGEGNATPSKPAREGERTAQSAVQHAAKAGRKS